ncbi:uncharacterized protein LOC8050995 isoform X3 [Ixodes scapularis]|uniref:uncharacterized protein LOC8050995 isoform X3 n=1 Tax=Ixodes scapularis TaxID=6945 RepID=UPI001C3958F3|nr:uncharacterized protein LOC8050995 isoform X3 [Ixodes scapularis]
MNLHKGDTAMVLYVTVINLGHDPLSLSIVSRTCCQQVSPTDIDCDSMLMIGGDMGDIYPGDVQNLTVFYPNMYLIDRVGYCELEIGVPDGEKILHKILFNTTVPRSGVGVPPFLNDYYSAGELKRCRTPDLDPTRDCKPVLCDIKYNGLRNFFNETSFRCEPTANCWDTSDDEMKVNCHNGRPDPSEGWCVCDPGWKSDPLDHDGFNPDLMVYHMCTVFSETSSSTVAPGGGGSAKGRHTRKMYIAYVPKKRRRMNLKVGELVAVQELPDNAREPVASVLVARSPDEGASVNGDDTLAGAASLIDRFLNDANTATFILPTLIVVVTMLACMVLGVAIFIVLECRKVKRISASLH